jgi:predicted secreted hydrolase
MVKLRYWLIAILITVPFVYLSGCSKDTDASKKADTQTRIFGRGLYSADASTELGEKADPNYVISLPKDHYQHTDFDIEWWYLTANLEDEDGNNYGLQWTLFRFRNPISNSSNRQVESSNAWSNKQIYMAHASVHSSDSHWFAEKFARGNVGNAGMQALRLGVGKHTGYREFVASQSLI